MEATLKRPQGGEPALVLALSGDIVLDDAADLYLHLRRIAGERDVRTVRVDFREVGKIDSAGAVAASLGRELFERASKRYELENLSEQHTAALELVTERRKPTKPREAEHSALESLFARLAKWRVIFSVAEVVIDTVTSGFRSIVRRDRRRMSAIAEQTVVLGVDSWFIVGLLSFLIGVILAFQGAFQLRKFGADVYMAELVSLGMVREFAPFITAIVLAGRSGAAMAAEIGTMAVNEEVDALKSMGISSAEF
jgi:phospholipid/cholesterol/gamma-HCH transport system permease protein